MNEDLREIKQDIGEIKEGISLINNQMIKNSVVLYGYNLKGGIVKEVSDNKKRITAVERLLIKIVTVITLLSGGIGAAIKFF